MYLKKNVILIMIALIGMLAIGNVWAVLAGNTDSPSGPTDAGSQMVTLKQISDRLLTGATETKMTTFTEPASAPGAGTMHKLDEIMGAAPAVDDSNGATAVDVASGQMFWGLTSGEWGLQTGTGPAACNPVTTFCGIFLVVPTKTGQTTCYDYDTMIDCAGTGQDGEYQLGGGPPQPPTGNATTGAYNTPEWVGVRFADNGDGTVTDNATGLIWLQDANCIQTQYPAFDVDITVGDGRVTWQHGLDFVAGINAGTYSNCGAGQTDWRLPNVNELHSLIDITRVNPALPFGHPFFAVQLSTYYWSSTTYEPAPFAAWDVILTSGSVVLDNKTDDSYVWPVRAGQ